MARWPRWWQNACASSWAAEYATAVPPRDALALIMYVSFDISMTLLVVEQEASSNAANSKLDRFNLLPSFFYSLVANGEISRLGSSPSL